ncbi:sulfatase [Nocardioides rotundus]|uniref:sulfatase family protein n=1 Tax=Nocardioides rotundus TaxID=1774216 RepID=UPI001CBD6DBA|nr:sulfatase [Nocardioides rotundus]UAL30001.1 sulfatase [Nocardioides rotundus]
MKLGRPVQGVRRPLAAAVAAVLLLALASVVTTSAWAEDAAQTTAVDSRPNIIFILTDDMRLDDLRFMPATRKLVGGRGVTFTRARSNNPLCCPARATILTGKLSHNNRVFGNKPSEAGGFQVFKQYNDVGDTLPVWLQRQGYRTGFFGKYLNEFQVDRDHDQPGWTEFAVPTNPTIYRYDVNRFWINGQTVARSGYRERFQRGLLLDMIDRWGTADRPAPYFVWYNSLAPHNRYDPATRKWPPPLPERKYAGTVRNAAFTPRPSVYEDVRDKPRWVRYRASTRAKGFHYAEARGRAMALKSVDDTVRLAVEKVRAQGELGNTVFIFSSDNGIMLGEHELNAKAVGYEESTRIPLLVAGPGFARKVTVTKDVSLVDVVPTILRAAAEPADTTAQHGLDGAALQDLAGRSGYLSARPTLIEGEAHMLKLPGGRRYPVDGIGRAYSGVVWRDAVYVTYRTGEREFYRLDKDPWQLTNIYDRDRPASSLQQRMARWLAENRNCRGDACRASVPR